MVSLITGKQSRLDLLGLFEKRWPILVQIPLLLSVVGEVAAVVAVQLGVGGDQAFVWNLLAAILIPLQSTLLVIGVFSLVIASFRARANVDRKYKHVLESYSGQFPRYQELARERADQEDVKNLNLLERLRPTLLAGVLAVNLTCLLYILSMAVPPWFWTFYLNQSFPTVLTALLIASYIQARRKASRSQSQ